MKSAPMSKPNVQRFYPSRTHYKSFQEWDNVRRLYDAVYRVEDQLNGLAMADKSTGTGGAGKGGSNTPGGGGGIGPVSATHLLGLSIKAVPPLAGQSLKWNAATGQIEWTT